MFWSEEQKTNHNTSSDVIDVIFKIKATNIPCDHIFYLQQEILRIIPEYKKQSQNSIQNIHISEQACGWVRDDNKPLQISKRTHLNLRLHKKSIDLIDNLTQKTLNINSYPLQILSYKTRPLKPAKTLLSRFVYSEIENEENFLISVAQELKKLNIDVKKMLCGKTRFIKTSPKILKTRSLLIADLKAVDSIKIQQEGIGDYKLAGCGIFIPYKNLDAVR